MKHHDDSQGHSPVPHVRHPPRTPLHSPGHVVPPAYLWRCPIQHILPEASVTLHWMFKWPHPRCPQVTSERLRGWTTHSWVILSPAIGKCHGQDSTLWTQGQRHPRRWGGGPRDWWGLGRAKGHPCPEHDHKEEGARGWHDSPGPPWSATGWPFFQCLWWPGHMQAVCRERKEKAQWEIRSRPDPQCRHDGHTH